MDKFRSKLNGILERYNTVGGILNSGEQLDQKTFATLSKEFSDLGDLASKIGQLNDLDRQLEYSLELAESGADKDLREMAEEDVRQLKDQLGNVEHDIKIMLIPKDIDDDKSVILEIRAGTGGDEAGLFAGNLFRMYELYAANRGWNFEVLNMSENGIGSVKEVNVSISGKGAYSRLKYESGGHRVQRVPETESSGRIHTSAATVAVLPEAEEVDVQIEEKDLQIDTYRASGAGGQHVNKTDSAVRITHIPTGVVVAQQDERSQHKNKAKALKILRSKIYEMQKLKNDADRAQDRKSQVGSGDRSERIRTYNFPQGRVTDHRINFTLYKIEKVMDGTALDEIIDKIIEFDQAEKLKG